jgi:hypothetical protein
MKLLVEHEIIIIRMITAYNGYLLDQYFWRTQNIDYCTFKPLIWLNWMADCRKLKRKLNWKNVWPIAISLKRETKSNFVHMIKRCRSEL